jgi:hypothetical protein
VPLPAGHLIFDRCLFVLPQGGHRRVQKAAVGPLLDAQLVGVDAVPEELGVPRGRGPHHRVGVEIVRDLGTGISVGGPELHDAPHHLGDVLVADLPADLLRDAETLAQRRPLRADDVGELGGGPWAMSHP